jgi:hypothetical protein
MTQQYRSPTADDRILWDLHQSGFPLATLLAADELGVFQSLAQAPAVVPQFEFPPRNPGQYTAFSQP